MSKIDELVQIGRAARTAYIMQHQGVAGVLPDAERAATIAVVRAVRDEFGSRMKPAVIWDRNSVDFVFNEILGAAGDEVAGGRSRLEREAKAGSVSSPAPATAPAPALYAGQDPKLPLNTDPAPAVCVWTRISEFDTVIHYSTPHGVMNDLHLWRGLQCSACHAPIKFTEAKT